MFCQKQDALRDAAGHNLSRGGAMRTNLLALAVASALMLTQASVYAVEPVDPAAVPQVVPSASVSAPDSAAPTEASSDAVNADTATAAVAASVAPTEVTTDADAANAALPELRAPLRRALSSLPMLCHSLRIRCHLPVTKLSRCRKAWCS